MIYPAIVNIVPFLQSLLKALQPYAKANGLRLSFSGGIKKQELEYHPFLLSQSVTQLICSMIYLVPPGNSISMPLLYSPGNKHVQAEIENTGINLIRVNEICKQSSYSFAGYLIPNGTVYRLMLSLKPEVAGLKQTGLEKAPAEANGSLRRRKSRAPRRS